MRETVSNPLSNLMILATPCSCIVATWMASRADSVG